MKTKYKYMAKVLKVIDGDTLELEVDLGFGIKKIDRFRILDLDTYETRLGKGTTPADKAKGIEAREFAKELIQGHTLPIETFKDKRGKYGRYLCSIYLPSGAKFAQVMRIEGYEKPKGN